MTEWKKELTDLFDQQFQEEQNQKVSLDVATMKSEKEEADEFLCTVVDSALQDLATELHKHGRKVCNFGGSELSRELEISFRNRIEFRYVIDIHVGAIKTTVHTSYMARYQSGRKEHGEGIIMKNNAQADIADITKDDIIDNFMKQYNTGNTLFVLMPPAERKQPCGLYRG